MQHSVCKVLMDCTKFYVTLQAEVKASDSGHNVNIFIYTVLELSRVASYSVLVVVFTLVGSELPVASYYYYHCLFNNHR